MPHSVASRRQTFGLVSDLDSILPLPVVVGAGSLDRSGVARQDRRRTLVHPRTGAVGGTEAAT